MATLTKREKLLLYILLCIVIVVGGFYFLVSPALNRQLEAREALNLKQTEQLQAEQAIATIVRSKEALDKVQNEIKVLEGKYLSEADNEQIDTLITNLCIAHGLTPTQLSMTDRQALALPKYGESAEETAAAQGTEGSTQQSPVQVMSITIATKGNLSALTSLADAIKDIPYLQINAASASEPSGSTYKDGALDITVDFEVYLYEAGETEN